LAPILYRVGQSRGHIVKHDELQVARLLTILGIPLFFFSLLSLRHQTTLIRILNSYHTDRLGKVTSKRCSFVFFTHRQLAALGKA